jgi:hypothetical protein
MQVHSLPTPLRRFPMSNLRGRQRQQERDRERERERGAGREVDEEVLASLWMGLWLSGDPTRRACRVCPSQPRSSDCHHSTMGERERERARVRRRKREGGGLGQPVQETKCASWRWIRKGCASLWMGFWPSGAPQEKTSGRRNCLGLDSNQATRSGRTPALTVKSRRGRFTPLYLAVYETTSLHG